MQLHHERRRRPVDTPPPGSLEPSLREHITSLDLDAGKIQDAVRAAEMLITLNDKRDRVHQIDVTSAIEQTQDAEGIKRLIDMATLQVMEHSPAAPGVYWRKTDPAILANTLRRKDPDLFVAKARMRSELHPDQPYFFVTATASEEALMHVSVPESLKDRVVSLDFYVRGDDGVFYPISAQEFQHDRTLPGLPIEALSRLHNEGTHPVTPSSKEQLSAAKKAELAGEFVHTTHIIRAKNAAEEFGLGGISEDEAIDRLYAPLFDQYPPIVKDYYTKLSHHSKEDAIRHVLRQVKEAIAPAMQTPPQATEHGEHSFELNQAGRAFIREANDQIQRLIEDPIDLFNRVYMEGLNGTTQEVLTIEDIRAIRQAIQRETEHTTPIEQAPPVPFEPKEQLMADLTSFLDKHPQAGSAEAAIWLQQKGANHIPEKQKQLFRRVMAEKVVPLKARLERAHEYSRERLLREIDAVLTQFDMNGATTTPYQHLLDTLSEQLLKQAQLDREAGVNIAEEPTLALNSDAIADALKRHRDRGPTTSSSPPNERAA